MTAPLEPQVSLVHYLLLYFEILFSLLLRSLRLPPSLLSKPLILTSINLVNWSTKSQATAKNQIHTPQYPPAILGGPRDVNAATFSLRAMRNSPAAFLERLFPTVFTNRVGMT